MAATAEAAARAAFAEAFGAPPDILGRAPGRVELLGNHTDYNGGLVLAAAIDRDTVVVGRGMPAAGSVRVRSVHFDQVDAFDPSALDPAEASSWGRYVRGVCWALQERFGPLTGGLEAALAGDVPLGAGLSSSASLQAAVAMALLRAGLVPGQGADELDDPARMELARTLRRSENEFVGVASGLLDQFSSLFGRADHALFLDCRSLEYDRVPLGHPAPAIVICDSKTSRRLADGKYNERFAECQRAVAFFREAKAGEVVSSLRDVAAEDLARHGDRLDPVAFRRARHVVTENGRVRRGMEVLRAGDLAAFGRLMSASHASSRDDFANSSPALDALIEAAEAAPGFLGGKLSGAGWAGCTVNLAAADRAADFAAAVQEDYARRTGVEPEVHICRAAGGASARGLDGSPRSW